MAIMVEAKIETLELDGTETPLGQEAAVAVVRSHRTQYDRIVVVPPEGPPFTVLATDMREAIKACSGNA